MKNAIFKISVLLLIWVSSVIQATPECRFYYSEKDLSLNKQTPATQVSQRSGHVFKLIKLSEVSLESADYAQALYYLNDVFPQSLKGLNKGDEFLNRIKKTNDTLLNQMNVLLMFEKGNPQEIIAGIVFVVAKNRDEHMAFQEELPGISVHQVGAQGYPVVEIARVGIHPETDSKSEKFRLLINTVFDVAMTSKDIHKFYAFTSRLHRGLYSRFGYKTEIIARPESHPQISGQDIILEDKLSR